jgi:hypothetical protein
MEVKSTSRNTFKNFENHFMEYNAKLECLNGIGRNSRIILIFHDIFFSIGFWFTGQLQGSRPKHPVQLNAWLIREK